ncbi:hypothetical protein K1X45_00040 [Pseudochrobactrum sp. Wa41.01b-1]|uniref:hypothetical protein n=1 Tax=Pseudochrobactrum sp. Wa41.01b-1 TaxID=2864102 RepID=UPI001C68AE24|nr:hypothetical protein [Pseudochrobactrum sp. Wa41.01b-1]QYM72907.1 hypothetical protein K1X45_00040 [Pseudochrobactrum sp. Wa41.01b-1]
MSTETKLPDAELVAEPVKEDAPKTLHELNMEQRAIDRSLREVNEKAANAAAKATLGVLNKFRHDGKRMQKPVRSPVTE